MVPAPRLVDLVNERLEEFLADRASILRGIAPDLDPLSEFSERFLSGGKRFRARFCHLGWEALRADGEQADATTAAELEAVVSASAALEVFHAAALVHDDLIDHSDTRRGAPSAHRVFEAQHRDEGWSGDSPDYGRGTAILLGDLLLGWSDELLDLGLATLARPAAVRAAPEPRAPAKVPASAWFAIASVLAFATIDVALQGQFFGARQDLVRKLGESLAMGRALSPPRAPDDVGRETTA